MSTWEHPKARMLRAIADTDTWETVNHVAAITVARVIAVAWAPGRLAECKARLADNERAPRIYVNRYWLHGEPWYIPSDGNHRTIAAREAGHKYIRAEIGGEVWCKPERYCLDADSRLWRNIVDVRFGPCLKLIQANNDAELTAELQAAGVLAPTPRWPPNGKPTALSQTRSK